MILGGGPNRIGQGIEFDYCCVHASFALREEGYESIMVNSNPETVSTDYDTSDKLFFEPVTLEDVLHIIKAEKPQGVIVQFGGQTPLNLARGLEAAGAPIIGTSPDAIDRAEDRKRFQEIVDRLKLRQPANGTAMDTEEAIRVAERIGYPVLVRPSYVLGGRSMEIIYDTESLRLFMVRALEVSPGHPILIDKFLEDAIEVDVDAISDGKTTVVAGIMEHIEEAGIHSGDSACSLPTITFPPELLARIETQTKLIAAELGVVGLMNIQYAIKDGELYVLEVNPRASRTVPFVSKAIGVPLAKLATKVMLGKSLQELGFTKPVRPKHISVKEAVFPFSRFPNVDILLGPEMKSTGEVMGIDRTFGMAFAKSQMAVGLQDAACGEGLPQRPRFLQGADRPGCRGLRPDGVSDRRHARDGGLPPEARGSGRDDPQGERGEAQRDRPHQERRDPARHQREPGAALLAERRLPHPPGGARLQRPVHDDDLRRPGARGGDRRPPEGALGCDAAPGVPRNDFRQPMRTISVSMRGWSIALPGGNAYIIFFPWRG